MYEPQHRTPRNYPPAGFRVQSIVLPDPEDQTREVGQAYINKRPPNRSAPCLLPGFGPYLVDIVLADWIVKEAKLAEGYQVNNQMNQQRLDLVLSKIDGRTREHGGDYRIYTLDANNPKVLLNVRQDRFTDWDKYLLEKISEAGEYWGLVKTLRIRPEEWGQTPAHPTGEEITARPSLGRNETGHKLPK